MAGPAVAPSAAPAATKTKTKTKTRRRGLRRPRTLVVGICGVAAAGALVTVLLPGSSPASHSISVPTRLAGFMQEPSLATSAGATALRSQIVGSGGSEARHVVDAVYEAGAKSGVEIVLFVGGNLAGSGVSFIASLSQALPGAFTANPGSLHGQAVCAPSRPGQPAECAWADNDTFGVLVSPGLTATALAAELRQMRPGIEHVIK
jgi:hypothetical protein